MKKDIVRRINIYLNDKEFKNAIIPINREYKKQLAIFKAMEKSHPNYKEQAKLVAGLKIKVHELTNEQKKYLDSLTGIKKKNNVFGSSLKSIGKLAVGAFAVTQLVDFGKEIFNRIMDLRQLKNEIKSITGLKGFELVNVTVQAKSIAETYNVEAKEAAKAANVLSDNFNLRMSQSLRLINTGFQTGANVSGQLLESISEYSPLMSEAKISAEEFISIIAQSEKKGIWSDKGVDAIKEGYLAIREGTKATKDALTGLGIDTDSLYQRISNGTMTYFDALQLVSKKMAEVGNNSEVTGTAMADIWKGAGEDAGFKFISQLHQVNTNLDDLIDSSDEYIQLKQKEYDVNMRLNQAYTEMTSLGGLWNTLMVEFKSIGADVLTMLTDTYKMIELFGGRGYLQIAFDPELAKTMNGYIDSFRALTNEAINSDEPLKKMARLLKNLKEEQARVKSYSVEGTLLQEQINELEALQKEYLTNRINRAKKANKKEHDNKRQASLKTIEILKKEKANVLRLQQELAELRIAQLDKGFDKELAQLNSQHNKKIEGLKSRLNSETKIAKAGSEELKSVLLDQNKLINNQILESEELHQIKYSTLVDSWVAKNVAKIEQAMQNYSFVEDEETEETDEELGLKPKNKSADLSGIDYDIFGFTADQWQQGFEALEEGENRFERFTTMVSMGLSALTNGWGQYYANLNHQDQARFNAFSKQNNAQRETLQNNLDKGLISQKNYDKQVRKLDADMEKERAILDYNKAKRAKVMSLLQIGTSTASAIMQAVAALPLTGGMPWTAIIAGIGLTQSLAVAKTELPSKGYFYGGYTGSGIDSPYSDKYGPITGVVHPHEYVIPAVELEDPIVSGIVSSLEAKRTGEINTLNSTQGGNIQLLSVMSKVERLFTQLLTDGVKSQINWGYKDTNKLNKQQDKLNRIKNNG